MGRGEERRVAELVGLGFARDELEVGYRFRTFVRTVTVARLNIASGYPPDFRETK